MSTMTRRIALVSLASVFALAATLPAAAAKKFSESEDAKEGDEPQTFLKDYDKLVKGKSADWVYFAEGADMKSYKTVSIKHFTTTGGKGSQAKPAAESGPGYLEDWIKKSKLGWKVVEGGAELELHGNIFNAWLPSGGARFFGGWMANPGAGIELMGKDKSGKVVVQIRQKSKGSTLEDAVENSLEEVVKSLDAGK